MTDSSRPVISQVPHQTREAMLQHQLRNLRQLLQRVWQQSSFYREYYGSHGIKEKDLPEITIGDLPFLSKQTLMENFDSAVTDPRLRKKNLEQWIENVRDPEQLYQEDLIVVHSSGSSGDIAIFVYDRKAWQIMNATVATHFPPPDGGSHARTRVASYLASHGHFAGVTTSVLLPKSVYQVLILSLLNSTDEVVEQLNTFQPRRLVGYSSSVAMLAELAIQGELAIQPQSIIVSGDLLTRGMEQRIHEAWRVPLYVVYAASESIYMGIKAPDQEEMSVMDELNILEVLDHDNRLVLPGKVGRVVLTNLYNNALPILRYELGDYVVRGKGELGSPFTTIQGIQGRVNDALPVILDNGTNDTIQPIILSAFFTAGLEKVQFISCRPDHVQIRYVAGQDIDVNVAKEFQRILNMKRAQRTTFEVLRVRQIDIDRQTGKLRLVNIIDGEQASSSQDVGLSSRRSTRTRCLGPTNPFIEFEKKEIEQSIPDRFEKMVRKFPDRIAVKTSNHVLTYDALNRAANRVGRAIVNSCGQGEELIALLFEQDTPAITAILGALKAGKIYVPLDPSLPQERVTSILEETQAGLIVTNDRNFVLARQWAQNRTHVLNIDTIDPSCTDDNIGLCISADAFALILCTSGSTGKPKGVVHTHINVLHAVMNYTNHLHICVDDRLTLLYSFAVMGGTQDIFSALLNGASLHPLDIKTEGMSGLSTWLTLEEVTIYHSVPTVFHYLGNVLTGQEKFPNLRIIKLIGEPVSNKDVESYKGHFPEDCIFVNVLSSTETGVVACFFIDKKTEVAGSVVPVGYAVHDKEVLLLDDHGNTVGFNQVGEIAVKSRFLSPGYWRRPDLTDAVFSADTQDANQRIYRTGNLGRMMPDGCLEHLGRKDFQVKIRGHRIEIEEIETAVVDHPAVKDCAVVAREEQSGQRLVAYWTPRRRPAPAVTELRRFLAQRLPDYMIPSVFLMLDTLPRTPTGKVDRRALPAPDNSRPELHTSFVAPRTPVEKELAKIWANVLSLDQVGIHDSFFDLGGHSLAATRVVSRVIKEFQMEIPLRSLFEAPTAAEMAAVITENQAKRLSESDLTRILSDLEKLTEQDAQQLLAGKRKPSTGTKGSEGGH